MLLCGLAWFGAFEWFRESVRKPYVITGYMYGNGVEVAQRGELQARTGYLPHIAFRTGNDGADLFRHACRSCHTIDGYKAAQAGLRRHRPRPSSPAMVRGAHLHEGQHAALPRHARRRPTRIAGSHPPRRWTSAPWPRSTACRGRAGPQGLRSPLRHAATCRARLSDKIGVACRADGAGLQRRCSTWPGTLARGCPPSPAAPRSGRP